jgi:hypothetical protein
MVAVGAAACGGDEYPYLDDVDAGAVVPDAAPPDAYVPPGQSGAVWLTGTLDERAGDRDAVQPFYPVHDPEVRVTGFDETATDFRFRRSDGALYYRAAYRGIVRDELDDDVDVATPYCKDAPDALFDFDGEGTLYYECPKPATIYRGDGVEVTADSDVEDIAGVLDDGRVIVSKQLDFVVLSATGEELARHRVPGSVNPTPGATTVVGNDAYLLFTGGAATIVRYDGEANDFTELGNFHVPVQDIGAFLVHPEGRLFINAVDPEGDLDDDRHIVSYDLLGEDRKVHWREAEAAAGDVRIQGTFALFYQP